MISKLKQQRWLIKLNHGQISKVFLKELEDWYAQNEVSLEKIRATNRESMNSGEKLFVAEMEPVEPGTEWEGETDLDNKYHLSFLLRVAKLCDFNPNTTKNVKDVSRLRSMILQLKQGPVADWIRN